MLYALMGCVFFLLFAKYYLMGIPAFFLILLAIDWVGGKKICGIKAWIFRALRTVGFYAAWTFIAGVYAFVIYQMAG